MNPFYFVCAFLLYLFAFWQYANVVINRWNDNDDNDAE